MLQLSDIGRAQISQLVALEVRLEVFVRVEIGAVGRKSKYVQPPMTGQELLNCFRTVKLHAIPQHEQRTPGTAQQLAKEGDQLARANRAPTQAEVTAATQANGGNRGQLWPVEAMAEDRGRPARSPGLGHIGSQGEPGFVEKQQPSAGAPAFFLMAGQTVRSRCRVLRSSRSRARRSGRCQENPKRSSRRHT